MRALIIGSILALSTGCAALSQESAAPAGVTQPPRPPEHVRENGLIGRETLLTINANASVNAVPDLVTIQTGVVAEADNAAAAMAGNRAQMNKVFDAMRRAGIAERDVQTSNLSLNPVYGRYNEETGRSPLVGYQVNNTVTVIVRKLDNVGGVLDSLVDAGANQVQNVAFGISDPAPLQNRARSEAMKEARARAQLYAEASGLRVARILTINEGYSAPPQPEAVAVARLQADSAASAPTPVAAGRLTVQADVNVTFALDR